MTKDIIYVSVQEINEEEPAKQEVVTEFVYIKEDFNNGLPNNKAGNMNIVNASQYVLNNKKQCVVLDFTMTQQEMEIVYLKEFASLKGIKKVLEVINTHKRNNQQCSFIIQGKNK